MIARVVLGIILGFLILAYYPAILHRGWPYLLVLAIAATAFYFLRAIPALAEPLGYGLLAVLVLYGAFLLLKYRGNLKALSAKARAQKLPIIHIKGHPQLSTLLTLVGYTIALTFISYLIILLVFVK